MKCFMAVTYQFVNDDFEIETGLLDFVSAHGNHQGNTLADCLIDVFDDFNIQKEQVFTITLDNASNNNNMIQKLLQEEFLDDPEHHLRCFAHVLNLTAQELIKYIGHLIKQLRTNCKFIRLSPQRLYQFQMICVVKEEKYKKPQIDVVTRWNSSYDMIVTSLSMKKSMDEFIVKQGNTLFQNELVDQQTAVPGS